MGLFEFILLANNLPFAISLGLMGGIASLQVVSLVLGLGVSDVIDDAFDFDADVEIDMEIDTEIDVHTGAHLSDNFDLNGEGPSFATNFFGWLQLGKVPFLILLSAFLGTFGMVGVVGQWLATSLLGITFTPLIAAPLSLLIALPITRVVGKFIARVMPKEESNAILLEDLTGKIATITIGTASVEMSAEAKIVDHHGTAHFVRVKPLDDSQRFQKGTIVRLMEKEGNTFKVVEQ